MKNLKPDQSRYSEFLGKWGDEISGTIMRCCFFGHVIVIIWSTAGGPFCNSSISSNIFEIGYLFKKPNFSHHPWESGSGDQSMEYQIGKSTCRLSLWGLKEECQDQTSYLHSPFRSLIAPWRDRQVIQSIYPPWVKWHNFRAVHSVRHSVMCIEASIPLSTFFQSKQYYIRNQEDVSKMNDLIHLWWWFSAGGNRGSIDGRCYPYLLLRKVYFQSGLA